MSTQQYHDDLGKLLDGITGELEGLLSAAQAKLEQAKEDAEAIKSARVAVQRKIEELERTHNGIVQAVTKTVAEYERLDKLSDRARNAMALTPPESPQAPKRAIRAIRAVPRLREELAKSATAIEAEEPISGVYFLLLDNDVVYVGQSVNVLSRVVTHCTDGVKTFNRWCYIKLRRDELDEVERFYISLLRPTHNVTHKPVLKADATPIFAEAPC